MADSVPEAAIITLDLLQKALDAKHGDRNISVKSFSVEPGSEKGDNYTCTLLAARIVIQDHENENELCWMIKTISGDYFLKQWLLQETNAFLKEVMFYKEVIPDMIMFQKKREIRHSYPAVPAFYYGKVGRDSGVLILENLKYHGYSMSDGSVGLRNEECRLVMEELGYFHALSWAMMNSTDGGITEYPYMRRETVFDKEEFAFKQLCTQQLSSCVKIVQKYVDDDQVKTRVAKLLELNCYDTAKEILKPMAPYTVLCHGDLSCNNMLFKYEENTEKKTPIAVKFIDFQVARYALPSTDLAYFFYSGTTRGFRQKHLTKLLRIYHSSFHDCLKKFKTEFPEFTFETLEQQYARSALFGIMMACAIIPHVVLRGQAAPSFTEAKSQEELDKYNKEYCEGMLALSETNVLLRDRVIDAMVDAVDMGVI